MNQQVSLRRIFGSAVLLLGLLATSPAFAQTSGASQLATWTCTVSPCPWGPSDSGHALAWPASAGPLNTRLGYSVSSAIYLPAQVANGTRVTINSGSANLYAGQPGAASHYYITSLGEGDSYQVSGLTAGEVLSAQSSASFTYTVTLPAAAPPTTGLTSQLVTWNCTATPCPWGPSDAGQALVWPTDANALITRLGYTTSGAIYLPTQIANGTSVTINSGTASLYAGLPGASSHYFITSIGAGGSYQVSGLAAGEVLSVQGSSTFTYQVTLGTASTPPPDPPPSSGPSSKLVVWNCTSNPCPWGASTDGHALVWPAVTNPVTHRLGYTVTDGIYLPAEVANGMMVWIDSGSASLYVGMPNGASHSLLTTITAGGFYEVQGVPPGGVLSVQSSAQFSYAFTLADSAPIGDPNDIQSVSAYWRCNLPGCNWDNWAGAVINWPSWAAYSTNARSGISSRTVYSLNGELLYPYMGAWANGCQVTAKSGTVLIIEWERGTDVWRETYLGAGETHVINLTSPEDGAMIETYDAGPPFSVELHNCTPQALP